MKPISILTYHSIDNSGSILSIGPTDFAEQMGCLAEKGFRGVNLREALAHRELYGEWPERSVVLTFDDGYQNFYSEGLPVLEEYGFSATVFIVTGYMGCRSDWDLFPNGGLVLPVLTWAQAAELINAGIEIGSHTEHHRDLRRCSAHELREETIVSRAKVQEKLGVVADCFAYPYGGVNHLIQHVAAREFRAACTTELRRAVDDPLNLLPRIDAYYLRSLRRFEKLLDGKLDQYLTVRRCGRLARRMFEAPAAEASAADREELAEAHTGL